MKLQGRIARPFEVTIPLFPIEKGEITDTFIKKHTQDIAPKGAEMDDNASSSSNDNGISNQKTTAAETLELAFLRDVHDYPDSGIAQRYKRLGISVRQGQKIKENTLTRGAGC